MLRLLRAREEATSFALLSWLAAFLVIPAIHLTHHDQLHRHGDGEPHTHAHQARPGPGDGKSNGPGPSAPAPGHGHGAVEHLAAALTATAIFVLPAAEARLVPNVAPAPRLPLVSLPARSRATPRGPPLAA